MSSYKHKVEMLFLSIAYISGFSCLGRTDFNFAFAFLSYYLWISKDDSTNSLIILVLNALTTVVDFIWLLSIGYIWTHRYKNNPVWDALTGLHVFVILCSVINMILKVIIQLYYIHIFLFYLFIFIFEYIYFINIIYCLQIAAMIIIGMVRKTQKSPEDK